MVVPTFTWQAYLAQRPAYHPHDDGTPNYTTTRRAPLHNPWWGSVSPKSYYDSTHGHHLFADLFLGTTASRVQHSVSVPVLLLRAR